MTRAMKDSGVDWIGDIPDSWGISKIKYACKLYTGNSIKDEEKDNYSDKEDALPYLASKDINTQLNTANYQNGMYVKKDDSSFKVAPKNATLMCIEGGSAGKKKTYLQESVAFVNKLCCFSPLGINPKYLFYHLNSPNFETEFSLHITGLIGGVSVSELKEFAISLPHISEQQKIADFLDKKCSEIDSVLTKTRESIEEYKKLKQSIITQAVTKGIRPNRKMKDSGIEWIGEIPEEWEVIKIKWLLRERKERSIEGKEEPLSMSQKYGIIPTKEMDAIPNMASSFIDAKLTYKGDLVFNKLKAHLGVFSVSNYDGLVSPDYAVYYATEKADVKYLEFLFKTNQYINEFKKKSTGIGAGLTRLYTGDLFSIHAHMPSLQEQYEIMEYVIKKTESINKLIEKKELLSKELETYKKSLIYEYVTGKKEVK